MQIKSFQALAKTLHRDQKRQDHVYIIQPCKPLGPCQSLAEGADESARPRLHRSKTCKSRALRLLPNLAEGTESQQSLVSATAEVPPTKSDDTIRTAPRPPTDLTTETEPRIESPNTSQLLNTATAHAMPPINLTTSSDYSRQELDDRN